MALTLGNWFLVGLAAVVTIVFAICLFCNDEKVPGLATLLIGGIITVAIMSGLHWYNTNTAAGARGYKDFQSNINNGIEREITITAEDGREIFHYEGKVDIESNHTDNYIKFESEEGKRYIIYYGIQDTIVIKEI